MKAFVNGIEVTADALLRLIKSSGADIGKITAAQERTLKSMLNAFIEDEDFSPGNSVCDFLGIERRQNMALINTAINKFINPGNKNEDHRS